MAISTATFAGGCFWCLEAAFNSLLGVQSAVSGYTGGVTQSPSYQDVCSGLTEHAGHSWICLRFRLFVPNQAPADTLEQSVRDISPVKMRRRGKLVRKSLYPLKYRASYVQLPPSQKAADEAFAYIGGCGIYLLLWQRARFSGCTRNGIFSG